MTFDRRNVLEDNRADDRTHQGRRFPTSASPTERIRRRRL